MEEKIYQGEYVSVNYIISENIQRVYCGKLEKISQKKDGSYNLLFSEFYDAGVDGEYKLFKEGTPFFRVISKNDYIGINPESKESLDEFYEEINKKNKEYILESKLNSETEYKKLGNLRDNFYSHGTKIGLIPNTFDDIKGTKTE